MSDARHRRAAAGRPAMKILFAGHHRALSVRRRHLVLADVPARPARARARGLLHRGHRRVRLRSGARTRARPIRSTAPPTSTMRSSRSDSAIAGRSSTTTAAITAAAPTTVRRFARRRRSLHQPVGRLVVLARRVRAHSAQGRSSTPIRRSRSSPSRRPSRGTSSSSSASIACSRSARTSARRRPPIPIGDFTWHKTWQPITLDDWRTDARAARSLHDRDDLADRELHRRRRQQGSGVRQVSSTCRRGRRSPSSWRSTARRRCCASTAGTPSTRCSVSRTPWDYREFIQRSKAEFGVAKHTYVATRSGWFSDRTECYLASGRPALVQDTGWTGAPAVRRRAARLLDARRGARRHRRDQRATTRATRGAPSRSRASISTRASCRALTACHERRDRLGARLALRIARHGRSHEHRATSRRSRRRSRRPKSGSVETMTSLLTEGLVARGHDVTLFATADSTTKREAARDLPARLLARREHVAVGAVRDAEPRGRGRARRASSTSSTTRRRTTRCRWRSRGCRRRRSSRRCTIRRATAEVELWSRYPEAPFVAISKEQARLLSGVNVVGTSCCTASTPTTSRSARRRTTTCCSSAASPKARACCRRSRSPSASACG